MTIAAMEVRRGTTPPNRMHRRAGVCRCRMPSRRGYAFVSTGTALQSRVAGVPVAHGRAPQRPTANAPTNRPVTESGGGARRGAARDRGELAIFGRRMSKVCHSCGKGPAFGQSRSHSMVATKRRFNPNLQKVRAIVNGSPQRVYVCTRCLKAGKVAKAV